MTDKEGARCEGVRLDLDVGAAGGAQEAGLARVGETRENEGAGVGVDGRQTTNMLADALEAAARLDVCDCRVRV